MTQDNHRTAFEARYPKPKNVTWTGNGYALTAYSDWNAIFYCHKFDGWQAAKEHERQQCGEPVAWRWLYNGKPDSGRCFPLPLPDADVRKRASTAEFPRTVQVLYAPPQPAEPVVWLEMPPSKGQSHILFEDGYAEGWAKCLDMCKAAVNISQPTGPVSPSTTRAEFELWAKSHGCLPLDEWDFKANHSWGPATYRNNLTEIAWRAWANKPHHDKPVSKTNDASCAECGKSAADGWALYCVACMDKVSPVTIQTVASDNSKPISVPSDEELLEVLKTFGFVFHYDRFVPGSGYGLLSKPYKLEDFRTLLAKYATYEHSPEATNKRYEYRGPSDDELKSLSIDLKTLGCDANLIMRIVNMLIDKHGRGVPKP